MDKKKSTKDASSNSMIQAFAISKGEDARERINSQMVQTIIVIWLDNNIDENNADCRNTVSQLRRVVNSIYTFTNDEQCINFIQTINSSKVCIIISGLLGQHVVPQLHDMSQVDSIFIFCGNKKRHKAWVKDWCKIKGVFTEIKPICDGLKQASQDCEQNAISISFVAQGKGFSTNLNQLDPSFMYTQILKEILLTIEFEPQHIQEFIDYCRVAYADNPGELINIKKFELEYRNQTPIWWYTYECFLYPMLNRALRLMDADLIVKLGFFIVDLYRHIEQLHSQQFHEETNHSTLTVYRGQGLSNEHFEKMKNTQGGLLSFNNFLSTSKDQRISMDFASRALINPDLVGVLFVMTVDPTNFVTPFASITEVSYFKATEEEVLFSMHTVFRIDDIKAMDENHRLFQVNLTLTDDNDPELRAVTNRIRKESPGTGWYRLGVLLGGIGQFAKSEQVYETILKHTTDEDEKGSLYHQIALAKDSQGQYQEAIKCYEKALEIRQKILSPDHPQWAPTYNNIGSTYRNMGEYSKALKYYQKSLEIKQKSLPSNHPDFGVSYHNIGIVYRNMGEYSKALEYHQKDLEIRQKLLPPNHPDLAKVYIAFGSIYNATSEYSKAIEFYETAVKIQEKSLPLNHPDLSISYNNIGMVYGNMGEYSKALEYYQKSLEVKQKSLPPNHPAFAVSYNNIGLAYSYMGEYSKALEYHQKDLEIKQKSLPFNHPDLGSSYNSMAAAYEMMNDYSKARAFYERALDIGQRSLPSNHLNIKMYAENLENLKMKMK